MKLRIRNVETKETLKVEAPEPCTLHQLKLIVSELASLSSPNSLHLSLNRKDDLSSFGSDPETLTLNSLGLTSGDLIFFSLYPSTYHITNHNNNNNNNNNNNLSMGTLSVSQEGLIAGSKAVFSESVGLGISNVGFSQKALIVEPDSELFVSDTIHENSPELIQKHEILDIRSETGDSELGMNQKREPDTQMEVIEETKGMEIDGVDDMDDIGTGKGFSVPVFLRSVFNKELGDCSGCDRKLVVIAVHALFKESGFSAFDKVSEKKIDGFFYPPDMWPSSGCTLSLCYTLPEIVHSSGFVKTVVVKVQRLGKFVNVYGSLAGKGSGIYRVCLDEQRLATVLNLMWANLDTVVENTGSVMHPEKEVFEFWKTVKDNLTLPLLIDLCEMANLPPPSCFVRLPTDLKLGILELLPGPDMAKAACVSLELRFLSSYDDLWEKKYIEEFGNVGIVKVGSYVVDNSWKRRFVKAWEAKKRRVNEVLGERLWVPNNFRDPGMFRSPRIIGGDYDMAPHFLWGGGSSRRRRGRDFMHCTFGNRRA